MLLIAGLGNPGNKYTNTRHNVGFLFVDYLINKVGKAYWKADTYSNAEIVSALLPSGNQQIKTILVKPQTYMNRSGESIRVLAKMNSLMSEQIIVAHDDLDLEFGKFKIQAGVGPKKHNGLSSIEQHLHTNNFLRIRIGVDGRQGDRTVTGEEYVLSNFTSEEIHSLQSVFEDIYSELLQRF